MIADLQIVLFTFPGAVSAVLSTCWLFGVLAFRPGLGGILGSGDKNQTTITTSYQDAFNVSTNDIRSNSDLGNVSIQPFMGGGAAASISSVAPLVVLVLAGLGGLWLVTRRS